MTQETIERLTLENFTAFKKLDLQFSPGVNLFIGANGTGKTHILKVLYTSLVGAKEDESYFENLIHVFLPRDGRLGRLVRRREKDTNAEIKIYRPAKYISILIPSHLNNHEGSGTSKGWHKNIPFPVYIPTNEILSNAPEILCRFETRKLEIEKIYPDIITRAYLPEIRSKIDPTRKKLLQMIQKTINGKVIKKNECFFLKNKEGELEFTLLAEGMRKLALLWLLIQNGSLGENSVLFWDEPEANLNPKLMETVVTILLELQRNGVQIFLATHNYVLLKTFHLLKEKNDQLKYFSLYRDEETQNIHCNDTTNYTNLAPNPVIEAYVDLYGHEIESVLQ